MTCVEVRAAGARRSPAGTAGSAPLAAPRSSRHSSAMKMRYTFTKGIDPRSTLVVDVCDRVDDQAVLAVKDFMYGYGCANGLLFDEEVCVLLRDHFTELSPASVVE